MSNILRLSKRLAPMVRYEPTASDWEALMPSLRVGRCRELRTADPSGRCGVMLAVLRFQHAPEHDHGFVQSPSSSGGLRGTLLVIFEKGATPPGNERLDDLMADAVRIGGEIAAVFALREQTVERKPCAAAA